MAEPEEFILVGRLGRTRGLKGDICVTTMTDFPDRFLNLKEIFVDRRGQWQRLTIESARLIAGRPVLKFAGMNSPEVAARLTNCRLAVPPDRLVILPRDTYFVFDLVGCTVSDQETGREIGEVVDVRRYPANDVYVIRSEDGREVLFPAVVEFVKEVDISNRKIVIHTANLFDEIKGKTGQ